MCSIIGNLAVLLFHLLASKIGLYMNFGSLNTFMPTDLEIS